MAEVPEHLLKRSRERRKALGLPVEGDDGDDAPPQMRPRPTPARPSPSKRSRGRRVRRGRGDHREHGRHPRAPARAVAQAQGRARGRRRRRRRTGRGRRRYGPRTAVAAPRPRAPGPGGHTQRLLTVVKSGSIQQTRAEAQDKVHVWPHLLMLEFASILSLMAFITIFSAMVKAPLLGLADVNATPNPSKAPWYFLGLQELLKMFNPAVAGVLIPGIALGLLAIVPYIDKNPSHKPEDRKFAITMMTMFLMMWAVLVIIGCFFRGPGLQLHLPVGQARHLL